MLTCDNCGKRFKPVRARWRTPVYCSRRCKEQAWSGSPRAAEVALRSYYRRKYNLTPEEADEMREAGCAICGTREWGSRWGNGHLDHDHKTGRLRGVLCTNCNIGIGKFQDDADLLRRAANYIDLVP